MRAIGNRNRVATAWVKPNLRFKALGNACHSTGVNPKLVPANLGGIKPGPKHHFPNRPAIGCLGWAHNAAIW